MFQFSPLFLKFQQEGHLIRSTTLQGLHALRSARVDDKGSYYLAFFLLSTGLERLMKTTFAINHMRLNSLTPPTDKQFKTFGHDLVELFNQLKNLQLPNFENPLAALKPNSTPLAILQALRDFAAGERYHNLESLSKSGLRDPLKTWDGILNRILREDVRLSDQDRIAWQSKALAKTLKRSVVVIGTDLAQKPLTVKSALQGRGNHELAARHAVWHTYVLVQALSQLLIEVSEAVEYGPLSKGLVHAPIPHMAEFFDFIYYERREVLRKRRWP